MAGTAVASPEEVCNLALDRIGYPEQIGDLLEGSRASRACLRAYSQTRDALLREKDWPFARRNASLSVSGRTPPPPWLYSYLWPNDCLKVRNVLPDAPGFFPVLDPRPAQWVIYNDPSGGILKIILATISPAAIIYTAQVADMTAWEPLFVAAFVDVLARDLALALSGSQDVLTAEAQLAEVGLQRAIGSSETRPPGDASLAESRQR